MIRTISAVDPAVDRAADLQAFYDSANDGDVLHVMPGLYPLSAPLDWTGKRVDVLQRGAVYQSISSRDGTPLMTFGARPRGRVYGVRMDGGTYNFGGLCLQNISQSDHLVIERVWKGCPGLVLRACGGGFTNNSCISAPGGLAHCDGAVQLDVSPDDASWLNVNWLKHTRIDSCERPYPVISAPIEKLPHPIACFYCDDVGVECDDMILYDAGYIQSFWIDCYFGFRKLDIGLVANPDSKIRFARPTPNMVSAPALQLPYVTIDR